MMMEKLPDNNLGISTPDLFEKFKIQLQKDFEICGCNGVFCTHLIADLNAITLTLITEIEKISKSSGSKLSELLYRIDINELQIKNESRKFPQKKLNEVIAALIIKRELQKIVYKEYFKKNE